ncbi:MAG TPA: hypothetical protein VK878_16305 [Candidatus Deferrimicrobiaceae bacterium]|nr:hypothetical protein [Candidatus Deferrimicrobiaceae bacterium]
MSPRTTSVTAILVGALVSFAGALLVLLSLSLSLSFLGAPESDVAWGKYGPKYLLCDLVALLASAAAGGFVTSLRAETARVGHSVVLGIVLLVCFLLAAFDPQDPAWYTTTAVLLMVPAAGLGGYIGKARTARVRAHALRARGARKRGIGAVGWIAGLIVAGTELHLLADRMGIGFTAWDAVALAVVAGLAGLLIGIAIAAPRRRAVRAVLVALSALVIPFGGLVLLARLLLGLSTLTASAASPDGRMVVQLVDSGRPFLDRNFSIRLRGPSGWWRHIWFSPDEGAPGGERFLWSRDGRHVLLIGPNFFARPESCLASGEFLYLHIDTRTGAVRSNATQSAGPRFALADLAGVEFTAPLDAGGWPVRMPGGPTRCEPASPRR